MIITIRSKTKPVLTMALGLKSLPLTGFLLSAHLFSAMFGGVLGLSQELNLSVKVLSHPGPLEENI